MVVFAIYTLQIALKDESGSPVGLTNADVKSGLGSIDKDGVYDTIYTLRLGDIPFTSEEARAMLDEFCESEVVGYFCNYKTEIEARYIMQVLGVDADDYFEEEDEL